MNYKCKSKTRHNQNTDLQVIEQICKMLLHKKWRTKIRQLVLNYLIEKTYTKKGDHLYLKYVRRRKRGENERTSKFR